MSLLHLLLKPANRNLLDVITKLPNLGVGSRVTRQSWEPYGDSYYEVWGIRTWRGVRSDHPELIRGRAKRVWRWMPPPNEKERLQQLARELQSQQDLQRLAAANGAAAAATSAAPPAANAEGNSRSS
eukprot:gene6039-6277_t